MSFFGTIFLQSFLGGFPPPHGSSPVFNSDLGVIFGFIRKSRANLASTYRMNSEFGRTIKGAKCIDEESHLETVRDLLQPEMYPNSASQRFVVKYAQLAMLFSLLVGTKKLKKLKKARLQC